MHLDDGGSNMSAPSNLNPLVAEARHKEKQLQVLRQKIASMKVQKGKILVQLDRDQKKADLKAE